MIYRGIKSCWLCTRLLHKQFCNASNVGVTIHLSSCLEHLRFNAIIHYYSHDYELKYCSLVVITGPGRALQLQFVQ